MKRILLVLVILILQCSCDSGKLTNSKAEKIISECLAITPSEQQAFMQLGNVGFTKSQKKEVNLYEKLKDQGFLKLTLIERQKIKSFPRSDDPLVQWRRDAEKRRQEKYIAEYTVELTKKSEIYVVGTKGNSTGVRLRAFNYIVDEVLEVQEIPELNMAKIKVRFKAADLTPFAELSLKQNSEVVVKHINMTNTSNGWQYCDNF